jgi:transposase
MEIEIEIPERLCHLPLVLDVLRRTGVLNLVDHAVRDDRRSKVSTSDCVAVIMCGVFLGHHDLWRMSERLAPYDMATIMQDREFNLAEFPEERLAKALDDLYDADLDRLMTGIALQAIEQFRLGTEFLHFDTTSLSFFGAYESEDFCSLSDGSGRPPLVTYGYSKDHRPDLKQIMFGSLVSRDGGVPLYGKALDGNRSDSESAAEFFQKVRSLVRDPKEVCCVADSKGWCGTVLALVQREGLRLLSRLPRHHRLHREIMAQQCPVTERVERAGKKGTKEADYYEISGFDVDEVLKVEIPSADPTGTTQRQTLSVPARAVRVFSSALLRQKLGTLARTRESESKAAHKQMAAWQAVAYACAEDAERAAQRHLTEVEFTTLNLHASVQEIEGPFKRGRGRPRKSSEPALDTERHYRIIYATVPAAESEVTQRLRQAATFIQIRTRNPGWQITDAEMIDNYRSQYVCEHGFSWLKSGGGPKGINPIYLATPKRIAALCFLYLIGLMVYSLIQRTVRMNLTKWNLGLPYHRNKPSPKITTRFLFELFPKVQTVTYRVPGEEQVKKVLGINPVTDLACRALGVRGDAFKPVKLNCP